MNHARRTLFILVATALVGCGGGTQSSSTSAIPNGATQGTSRAPLTTTITAQSELFVASGAGAPNDTVFAYPAAFTSGPAPAADRSVTPHPNRANTTIAGLAVQPDGTLDVMQNYFDSGNHARCQVTIYAPGASGSPTAVNTIDCGANGQAIAYDSFGGGFIVGVYDFSAQVTTVVRYSKAGVYLATPVTRPGFDPASLATDRGGHIYIADAGGNLTKFNHDGTAVEPTGGFGLGVQGPIAVAPDLTLYAAGKNPSNFNAAEIRAFTTADYLPGGTGTPSRTFGPYAHYIITALTVSSTGEVYAAFGLAPGGTSDAVRVYAANAASGKPVPVRALAAADPNNNIIRGLAVAP